MDQYVLNSEILSIKLFRLNRVKHFPPSYLKHFRIPILNNPLHYLSVNSRTSFYRKNFQSPFTWTIIIIMDNSETGWNVGFAGEKTEHLKGF